MFEYFFLGIQQDIKLAVLAPVVCALFRLAFIGVYRPKKRLAHDAKRIIRCFQFGFWWGMDFNAYVFLISMIIVSVPAAFIGSYYAISDEVRVVLNTVYMVVLYTAFMGKMIFYYHFHDIFNTLIRLGKNADKMNFLDIFFHQNHGVFILLGYIPYTLFCFFAAKGLLALPSFTYPVFSQTVYQYGFNALVFVSCIVLFYFFRFGGTLSHRNKPERDTIPDIVKEDDFLAKAVVDDLIALEIVFKHPVQSVLTHDDDTSKKIFYPVYPEMLNSGLTFEVFKKIAQGPRITKPSRIFFVVGESYTQSVLDEIFSVLHITDRGKAFRNNEHTFTVDNFLPAGLVSQPAVTSLMAGIYDCQLEMNETNEFWHNSLRTSLPLQLKKLGYRTVLWYGGSLSWASIGNFAKAIGFDAVYGGPDICAKGSPSTWLGIYDHFFLEEAARRIKADKTSQPVFHFVYTTSNHGPYTIPIKEYGWDPDKVMPDAPESLRRNKTMMANMGTYWYTDKSMFSFIEEMQKTYEDSLIIATGDHARRVYNYDGSIIKRTTETLREKFATSFAMYHREFTPDMFANNTIGGHMNILPTIFEAIAPKGFEYYSLMESFFEPIERVVTPTHWMTRDRMGDYRGQVSQQLIVTGDEVPVEHDSVQFKKERDAYCEITGWILRHPELLEPVEKLLKS